ncbi:hypothetical protein [Streptomyces sediminimaris]|uniref:hypothetical protein n=1 Tax=Streptomyces sediminimaris TaxID=3383721 RepID=UPI00399C06B4
MTEPTPLDKAEQAVREAAANTDVARIVAAVLATQQAAQPQPAPPPAPARRGIPASYVVLGIAGAGALTALAMAAAVLAVAVAVGAVAVTACLLVLRSMLSDFQKGK